METEVVEGNISHFFISIAIIFGTNYVLLLMHLHLLFIMKLQQPCFLEICATTLFFVGVYANTFY